MTNMQNEINKCAEYPIDWEILQHKTFLITGVTGLIGKYLLLVLLERNRLFNGNIKIIAIGRSLQKFRERFVEVNNIENIIFLEQDICIPLQIDIHIDYVIHLASNTHPRLYAMEPIATEMTNILGTNNMLTIASVNRESRILYASSGDIYGDNIVNRNFLTEEDCGYINCNTLRAGYIEGKRAGEALCNAFKEEKNVDFVIARLCRLYGFTMQIEDSKAVSQFILNAVNRENIALKSLGNQIFSYLYVYDAVTALLVILTKGVSGNAYNVADTKQIISLKELAHLIADIAGVEVVYENSDEFQSKGASSFQDVKLSPDKLLRLGWRPQFSMREGLKRTICVLQKERAW